MARCLRCHAGNEWIEGRVPDEPGGDAWIAADADRTRLAARVRALEETLRDVLHHVAMDHACLAARRGSHGAVIGPARVLLAARRAE